MPKVQEEKLKRIAMAMAKKGKLRKREGDNLDKSVDRFVYGTLYNQKHKKK